MSGVRGKLSLVRTEGSPAPRPRTPPAVMARPAIAAQDSSLTRDSFASTAFADDIGSLHAAMARFTAGLSPIALTDAYLDWASHLAFSPGKRSQLTEKALKKALRFATYASKQAMEKDVDPCIVPLPQDRRFMESSVARSAVRPDRPGVSARPAVVAQRGDRRARRDASARADCRLCDPSVPRRFLAVEFALDQSRGIAQDAGGMRRQLHPRRVQLQSRTGIARSAASGRRPRRHSRSGATSRSRPGRSSIAIG